MFRRSQTSPSPSRGMRGLATAIAFVLVLVLAAPLVSASQASLVPPHADMGVDTDGDALFNFLRIDVNLDVTTAGGFLVNVELWDGTYTTLITSAGAFPFLPLGPATLSIDFQGPVIRFSGINGPYNADIYVYDDTFLLDDFGTHVTNPYLATEFDPFGASFAPPHSDIAIDTDADTLFNTLRVGAVVDVVDAGVYTVNADLYDPFFGFIVSASNAVSLPVGNGQVIDLDFPGWTIRQNGVDGPYSANMNLYDGSFTFLGNDGHTTAAYTANQFETPPAAIAPPHSDTVIDMDGDTLYDILRVQMVVDVDEGGTYNVDGVLFDSLFGFIEFTPVMVTLPVGVGQTIDVDFTGWFIRQNGVDGPYTADLTLYDAGFNFLGNDVHTTAAYMANQFETPPAAFAPPHSDAVIDTDADTLYDILRVQVAVDVGNAGTYNLNANLFDQFFGFISFQSRTVTLPAGPQVVNLDFPGWIIRQNGVDGPFTVDMTLWDATFTFLGNDVHTTAAYPANQFETLPAAFAPPHADRGVDTDGDTLFNIIDVDVSLQVGSAGTYNLFTELYDSTLTTFLGFVSSEVALNPGPQVVTVSFSTIPMVSQSIPGPYIANLYLFTDAFDFLGMDTHTTGAYALPQFDPIPALFAPPHFDAGVDRDVPPDGLFNVLRVDASVNVVDPGLYAVAGILWDAGMTTVIASEFALRNLATGAQSVPVFFSGVSIRNSGFNGPYFVDLTLEAFVGGFPVVLDTDGHTTGPYMTSQFQAVTPASLTGTLTDASTTAPLAFADVRAFDYSNNLQVSGFTDFSGFYNLPVYDGNWVVTYDDFSHDGELRRVPVSGPMTVDGSLAASGADPTVTDAVMPSWAGLAVTGTHTFATDRALFRQLFDWTFGDRDQALTQVEFDVILTALGFTPPSVPSNTQSFFLVDTMPYTLLPGSDSFTWLDVPGPIDSATPFRFQTDIYYMDSVGPAPTHTIDLQVDYDSSFESFLYNLDLPPGYVLTSFNAPGDVTVSGIGTRFVTVDPSAGFSSVWIQLTATTTDTTAPVITGVSDAPDPVVMPGSITITADATDDTAVASAFLEVRDPSGAVAFNVSMTAVSPGSYEHTFAPAPVGLWTYTVTVADVAGNTDVATGQFNVIERNPPVVSGVSATPDPQEAGQPVLLAATVTDDTPGPLTVSAEVRSPTGAPVANVTMAFNATSGRYEATQSLTVVGALTFTVWAVDAFGNVGSAPGTVTIQDTTAPVLTNPDATPDPVEVGGTVRISVTAADAAGFTSVRVEIRDPNAVVLGPFTMVFNVASGDYEYDFTPAELGNYAFTITATDLGTNTATATGAFVSRDTTNPVANAGPAQTVTAGTTVTFNGSASSDNDAIASYTWTFTADGQNRTLTGSAPTYAFVTAGTYEVTLRVEDASGNFAETTVTITVQAAGGAPGSFALIAAIVAVIIAVLVALAIWFMKRKKAPPVDAPGASPPMDAPPPEGLPPPPE